MNCVLIPIKNISKHYLKSFDCGIEPLNIYLQRYALKNDSLEIGKTFIAINDDSKIIGYFTLCSAQINFDEMPIDFQTRLPRYPIPALRIARLAVDKTMQGQGVGKWLMQQAFIKIIQVADIAGVHVIIVDAKETAVSFYKQFGFIKLKQTDNSYFIPITTVRKAIYG